MIRENRPTQVNLFRKNSLQNKPDQRPVYLFAIKVNYAALMLTKFATLSSSTAIFLDQAGPRREVVPNFAPAAFASSRFVNRQVILSAFSSGYLRKNFHRVERGLSLLLCTFFCSHFMTSFVREIPPDFANYGFFAKFTEMIS